MFHLSNECILFRWQINNRENLIRKMWADHFETLGTPSSNMNFDDNFLARVTADVQNIFNSCIEDLSGTLCAPPEYDEVARVCSSLKLGVSGIVIGYEHIQFACWS